MSEGWSDDEQIYNEFSTSKEGSTHESIPRIHPTKLMGSNRAAISNEHSRGSITIHLNQSNSTEMRRRGNVNERAKSLSLQINDTLNVGTEKTKSLFSSASIYRVPQNIRELNQSAYTPRLLSIGPFHVHQVGKPYLYVKLYYANNLFLRLTEGILDQEKSNNKKTEVLQECVKEMEKSVEDAKKSYAGEDVDLDEMMLLVDGCFILELLYRYYDLMNPKASSGGQQPHEEEDTSKGNSSKKEMIDPIFDSILTENIVKHDLLLLENQIPFFVLERLFKLTVEKIPNRPHKCSLTHYVLFYFRDIMNPQGNSTTSCSANDCLLQVVGEEEPYYHILHLLHKNYGPVQTPLRKRKTKFSDFTLSASYLEYAGVRFKPPSGNSLFEVKFDEDKGLSWWCHRASFVIPTIGIQDTTEPFLRNLIAFEQCVPGDLQHFTSYAFLMDMLINSEKDVQVLKDAKVIYNYLGADEDASTLFNNLCKEVFLEDFYFNDTCSRAFKYSEYGWPKILAYLKSTYFASPWTFIGFCLAFVAFGMSVIQFVYGFL